MTYTGRARNVNLPQHELRQGHYGLLDLDEMPDASGEPSDSVIAWDSVAEEWIFSLPANLFEQVFHISGTLATGTNQASYWVAPNAIKIDEVFCHVGTAPTGAAILIDVNDDGTTVFTTQGNRPSIAAGTNDDTSGTADGGLSIAKNSVITIDIDQIGSGTAGSDLYVSIRGRYVW